MCAIVDVRCKSMDKFDNNIINIDNVICGNIDHLKNIDRALLSQNILAQLRNLIEAINLKLYSIVCDKNLEINWDGIKKANEYVFKKGEFRLLKNFFSLIEQSKSHYTTNDTNAERLMIKYYEYLIKIKSFVKKQFGIDILTTLKDFPKNEPRFSDDFHRSECVSGGK